MTMKNSENMFFNCYYNLLIKFRKKFRLIVQINHNVKCLMINDKN